MNIVNTGQATEVITREMDIMDNEDRMSEEDVGHFESISKMYIKDATRDGYNSANRVLLLWLASKHPDCIGDTAKESLHQLDGKELEKKALQIVSSASEENKPILFELVSVRMFIEFLHSRARKQGKNFLSKSGCGSYRSAYKELYRQCGMKMRTEFESDLSIKFKGLMRGYAIEKETTGGRLAEGKDPMSFSLYQLLCKKMMSDGTKESVFAHAFLTLTWNLICRSKNTVNIHRNHLSWALDCLSIRFAHTKTDVEGGDQARIRHVYANPHNPDICAITALAKYMCQFEPKSNGMLFDVKSYQRFQKYLKRLVTSCREEVERLGVNPKDIGVHSVRKGAATYCCGGTTAAPHIAAVCNRAGWTKGKVKDTYIQYAEAGDQHVGRVVAGLPVLNSKYACSPPFFCIFDGPEPKEVPTCTTMDVRHTTLALFPNFAINCPISLNPVLMHCAASLLFSLDHLSTLLPSHSPIRCTALFQEDVSVLRAKAASKISHAWENDEFFDSSILTGVPSHIVTYVNQARLEAKLDMKFDEYSTNLEEQLDKRQMGGNLTMELIHEAITNPIREQLQSMTTQIQQNQPPSVTNQSDDILAWTWDGDHPGVIRRLPQDFCLNPSISPLLIMHQWHHGLSLPDGTQIGALKSISPKDCPKKHRRTFQRMRKFCSNIDSQLNFNNTPSMDILNSTFHSNHDELVRVGILLQPRTAVGRKRTRNENGWNYVAHQFEMRQCLQKKAAKDGISFEQAEQRQHGLDRNRQRRYRRRKRSQHAHSSSTTGANDVFNNSPTEQIDTSVFDRNQAVAAVRLLT